MCFQQYISSHESSNLTPFELCLVMCYIANRLAWMFLEQCLTYYTYTSVDPDTCVSVVEEEWARRQEEAKRNILFAQEKQKEQTLSML